MPLWALLALCVFPQVHALQSALVIFYFRYSCDRVYISVPGSTYFRRRGPDPRTPSSIYSSDYVSDCGGSVDLTNANSKYVQRALCVVLHLKTNPSCYRASADLFLQMAAFVSPSIHCEHGVSVRMGGPSVLLNDGGLGLFLSCLLVTDDVD